MKKKILAIAMFVALGLSASAQSDGFFSYKSTEEYRDYTEMSNYKPYMPAHGYDFHSDADAPLGSGLLLLAGLGLGYAAMRKKD